MPTIRKRVSFSILVTILIGLPFMIGMILFAEPILELLFPNATSGSFIYQVSCFSIIFIVFRANYMWNFTWIRKNDDASYQSRNKAL